MAVDTLKQLEPFAEIIKPNEPLAPYTFLKIGGPAEALAQPRSIEELASLIQCCKKHQIPVRILGNGCNVLVRDEGVSGVVLRLTEPAFTAVEIQGQKLRAGAGAALSAVISKAAHHGLGGLETLVGIPGTLGGALRHHPGDQVADIDQYVRSVEVLDGDCRLHSRERDELNFGSGSGLMDDAIIVAAELELEPDDADSIVKRLRKAWIGRKAHRPPSYEAACKAFRDPRGSSISSLIEQADLAGTQVGGAQLSERNANYIIVKPDATAHDVLRLIDLIRSQIEERFQVKLETQLAVW